MDLFRASPRPRCPSTELPSPTSPDTAFAPKLVGTTAQQSQGQRINYESTKRRTNGARMLDLRHRRPDLYRHLIIANLQRNRADGGMVHRTSRLLQILHKPPSHQHLVLMCDNVRLPPRRVKQQTTRSCGHPPVKHNIKRKYSSINELADMHQTWCRVLFRQASAEDPPLLDRISTGLFTGPVFAIPQKIRAFLAAFAHVFRAHYQHRGEFFFQQLFRMNSARKKRTQPR